MWQEAIPAQKLIQVSICDEALYQGEIGTAARHGAMSSTVGDVSLSPQARRGSSCSCTERRRSAPQGRSTALVRRRELCRPSGTRPDRRAVTHLLIGLLYDAVALAGMLLQTLPVEHADVPPAMLDQARPLQLQGSPPFQVSPAPRCRSRRFSDCNRSISSPVGSRDNFSGFSGQSRQVVSLPGCRIGRALGWGC
jgi:hypothetical protein